MTRNPIPPDDEATLLADQRRKRRENARLARTCRCGEYFEHLQDKLIHQTLECPERGKPHLRNVSCHRCAREIDVNVTRTCECGFTLPKSAVNPL